MKSQKLIETLSEQVKQIINEIEMLKSLDLLTLTWREDKASWNILEVIEHLNRYGNFYLPEIEQQIKNSNSNTELFFKPGILGDYFAKSMLPKQKLNKMKTFKDKNPIYSMIETSVIDEFIDQQNKLLDLLDLSNQVSLNKVKIKISISSLIKLKLGDALTFYINHIIRHMSQIRCIKKNCM